MLFLVFGSLIWVGWGIAYGTLIATAVNQAGNVSTVNNAIDKLNSSYSTLNGNLSQWQSAVAACDQNLTCVTKQDSKAAAYFSAFASVLSATPMPSGASAAAARLQSDATAAAQAFTRLSQATTVAQYQSTFTGSGLRQLLDRFDQDYNALGTALENS